MIHTKKAYRLFHQGVLALADIEQNGIHVNTKYYRNKIKKLTLEIKRLQKELKESKEVKRWKKIYGPQFNINSNVQLSDMLFKHMKLKPGKKRRKKGEEEKIRPSVDEDSLLALDIPLCNRIIRIRKLKRAKDKISDVYRETVDGFLHPNFNLHLVKTFRSSCNSPNFQNMDVRNPEMAKLVRTGIIPRPGRQILEIDYKGIEVSISACYHKDPTMIADIIDPKRDMHRDMAMECYMLKKKQVTKDTRYCAKNQFVFPEFYGDYYLDCAETLWKSITTMKLKTREETPLREHLRDQGIKNYNKFVKHIQDVEDRFWNERYPVYRDWKEELWQKYLRTGYIEMKTGFFCYEYMKKNEAINRAIQGTAFHCLLWSLIQLNRWTKKEKLGSLVIGQIHDSVLNDTVPDELKTFLKVAKRISCDDIREHWDWIILPLTVEAELTPVDKSWFKKKEIEI